jgi:hypothetical protein
MILYKINLDITIIRQEQGERGGREEKKKKDKEMLEGRKKVVDIILNNNGRLQINVKKKYTKCTILDW